MSRGHTPGGGASRARRSSGSHILLGMTDPAVPGAGKRRWEYKLLWRYGPMLLAVVGLLAMGFGAAGVRGTAISATLLSLGFISLVAGVVLPRIEGKFTAGPSGLTAEVLAVHDLDPPVFVAAGLAVAVERPDRAVADELERSAGTAPAYVWVSIGDIWDALDAAGIRPSNMRLSSAYFRLPDGRSIQLPNREFYELACASDELLALLASWGIRPAATGKYQYSPDAMAKMFIRPPDHP
jgi:hypothetical protein